MDEPDRTVVKIDKKDGYEIRTEVVDEKSHCFTIESAYNPRGAYIGDPKTAKMLIGKGIVPQLIPSNKVCSIGFCEREQKWFGWSHRAICGFGIGDIVKKGDCTAGSGFTDEYIKAHPEADTSLPIGFRADTLEDAKKMAVAFARSVS
ncbi:MAG: hypothetical protein KAW09_03820 [Thermoplasmata archaeon]|nr:hypothetical protein [Thermoplasmata archaeon]